MVRQFDGCWEREGEGERGGERERETEGARGKERVREEGRELPTLLNGSIVIYKSFQFEFFLNELDKIITLVKFCYTI